MKEFDFELDELVFEQEEHKTEENGETKTRIQIEEEQPNDRVYQTHSNPVSAGNSDGDTGLCPSIPQQDDAHVQLEHVIIDGVRQEFQINVPAKPTLEHEQEMWDVINDFEIDAWSEKAGGIKTGWATMDEAFDGGVKPGFVVIAADSNIGKTAVMSQMAWQMVENNEDVYVLDFSLDDPMQDKLSRIIAAGSKVLLNAVKNPQNYTELPLMLGRRKVALNKLRHHVDRYRAYDATFTTYIEDIEEEIKRKLISLDASGSNKRLVVFIDNMHDLNIKNGQGLIDKMKYDHIAQWCADTAIRYNIPVIVTAELRKVNGIKRASLDDIRETVKIKYEAKAVIMVHNEVHYKGETAEVYFSRTGNALKQPVLELHFAKNKMHNFKGKLFYEFYPEMARLEEPDSQAIKHYASLAHDD